MSNKFHYKVSLRSWSMFVVRSTG